MAAKLKVGEGYDLFRMSLYEAAALGANMSVPYGAWLGSIEQDSFWAPHELCVEIQTFLADRQGLFGRETYSEIAVVYSVASHLERGARAEELANNQRNVAVGEVLPFWEVCATLSDGVQPYDVRFFPDGELRPDGLTLDDLRGYRTLILPECFILTPAQGALLTAYLDAGGHVIAIGDLGTNLPAAPRTAIIAHPRTTTLDLGAAFRPELLPQGPQLRVRGRPDLAVNVQRVEQGAAIHLIRYDYDAGQDRVPPLPELTMELRLPETPCTSTLSS